MSALFAIYKSRRHQEYEYPATLYPPIYVVIGTIDTTKWWIYYDYYDGSLLSGITERID